VRGAGCLRGLIGRIMLQWRGAPPGSQKCGRARRHNQRSRL